MGYVKNSTNYIYNGAKVLFYKGVDAATALVTRIFFAHKTKRTHVMGVGLRISRVFGPRL